MSIKISSGNSSVQVTSDLRVKSMQALSSPKELLSKFPASQESINTVTESRAIIERILEGTDSRLLLILGPCSIHDPESAYEYARRVRDLQEKTKHSFFLIMRVYFEKPRTRLGWKGLIMDPYMNGTNDIAAGLILARQILCTITSMGVPAAIEALDPIIPQYIDDLVSWAAIGARTTESQTHREMASGLSMAVGFKNGTDGSIDTAINAMASSLYPHSFIGIDAEGRTSIVHTSGNDLGHIILRGGKNGPNYHRESIESAGALLVKAALPNRIIIDCSHANSAGDFHRQTMVLQEVVRYHCQGVKGIRGLMLESHLLEGRQDISSDLTQLVYGVSVTDACIGWRDSEQSILQAAETLASFACTTS